MKTNLTLLRVQAGIIEDNNKAYSNAFVLADSLVNVQEPKRNDVGYHVAKMKVDPTNDPQLVSKLIHKITSSKEPLCNIEVEVSHIVKKGEAVLSIVGLH